MEESNYKIISNKNQCSAGRTSFMDVHLPVQVHNNIIVNILLCGERHSLFQIERERERDRSLCF